MSDFDEGTYTLLLRPYTAGGDYSVSVHCPATNSLPELVDLGWTPATIPLSECQGDCDNDNQCQGDLVCFENDVGETNVPEGCSGTANNHVDYCYRPQGMLRHKYSNVLLMSGHVVRAVTTQ